nr:hypothetical protein [Pseudovibrio flavus]
MLLGMLRLLPLDVASAIPGKLMRWIAPLTHRHKRAHKNLSAIMPELSKEQREEILCSMWENMGRVFGEIPNLTRIASDKERFRFEGLEEARSILAEGRGALAISGHFSNWELTPAPSFVIPHPQLNFYRTINNPILDGILKRYREKICPNGLVPKGNHSLLHAMRALRKGQMVGMLVDQRTSGGLTVPFLGLPAETTHAPALLACRHDAPILAGVVLREKGARFKMICTQVPVSQTGDLNRDVEITTMAINALLGTWVREHPHLWLWSHRRWRDIEAKASQGIETPRETINA